jgi:YegS/Rv2252/BmrU family lipid kinase
MATDSPAFLFLINPQAGQRQAHRLPAQIQAAVDRAWPDSTCEIRLTDRAHHANEMAADFAAAHGSRALVVACGGDGTAHEVANALAGTQAVMTVLPVGSSNDFARTALSSMAIDTLLSRLASLRIAPIDLIRVNDRYCLNIASFGFDTVVLRRMRQISARFRFLGLFSYQIAIVLALFGNRRFTLRCRIGESEEQPVDYILAALCNGRYYGGGFNPAPTAQLDDGLLEFLTIDPMPLRRILGLIPVYKKGRHLADPAVHARPAMEGSLVAPEGQLLLGNLDGELYETARIDFAVVPRALRFAFY